MPEAILAAAETIPLPRPAPAWVTAAASRTVARQAADKDDLAALLAALGLPAGEDDITALLPLLPTTSGPEDQDDHKEEDPDMAEEATTTEPTAPALPVPADSIEQLLAWADTHPTAGIRSRAARIRDGLARLAQERDKEQAVADAEAAVARLRAQLAKAEKELRQAKQSSRPAAGSAPATVPDVGTSTELSREERDRIRAWARANGHRVADRGLIPAAVVQAYRAAHPGGEYTTAS
ncbi:Lsr2 family DNA-binding protein [Streptomyces aidingensis]|uniref:Lsr2 protein n=1 Tax=Streptomyces aidingensis TaxID=910347 RepID=A0A1I1V1W6_9ACTN|nr:histone-like nucleoid-structuring protein Lsr2 [Streptomyces aidingensis]SFD74290.1 Lsr2 protein [Streptomyces aidingensis]